MGDSLLVSRMPSGEPEIFRSIQGEGPSAGTPSTFIRLATCNLRCRWCDTAYTWDWATFDRETRTVHMSISDIMATVSENGQENVVVTGGEPLLQMASLASLARQLRSQGHAIEVETNGTIAPTPDLLKDVSQWNVSPKLDNSGETAARREKAFALSAFAESKTAYFKFVICEAADVNEVTALIDRHGISRRRVYLMPEGVTADAVLRGTRMLAESAAAHGYRISTRLHILLWGDTPGR